MEKNLGGELQGVARELEAPGDPKNPIVEGLPRGDKNFGVTLKGKRIPSEDRPGSGGDKKPQPTRRPWASIQSGEKT